MRRATHAVRSIRDVCAEAVRRARAYAPVRTHAPHLYIYIYISAYLRTYETHALKEAVRRAGACIYPTEQQSCNRAATELQQKGSRLHISRRAGAAYISVPI